MRNIKFFLCVALFGAMSFGVFSAYDYYTMSADEKALLENIEALTSGEGYPVGNCVVAISSSYGVYVLPCDSRTTNDYFYSCPSKPIYADWNRTARCIED